MRQIEHLEHYQRARYMNFDEITEGYEVGKYEAEPDSPDK